MTVICHWSLVICKRHERDMPYFYNTPDDVEALGGGIERARALFA